MNQGKLFWTSALAKVNGREYVTCLYKLEMTYDSPQFLLMICYEDLVFTLINYKLISKEFFNKRYLANPY